MTRINQSRSRVSGKLSRTVLKTNTLGDWRVEFNPFRPVRLDSAWLTPTVSALARAVYEERQLPSGHLDLVRLAVLADALEEAGCTDADLLGHLHQPGQVQVRGCWVVDLLLGKE